jgi:hypothetical protein
MISKLNQRSAPHNGARRDRTPRHPMRRMIPHRFGKSGDSQLVPQSCDSRRVGTGLWRMLVESILLVLATAKSEKTAI